tara:strand:+ start:8138 stop:9040 length:903 start_codon:yes stop_codon:yes gene_type:complete
VFNGKLYQGERGYIELIGDILSKGVDIPDRTGVGSRAVFDAKIIYSPDEFPFSTIRPAPLRMAFEEFWFFLRGQTQTKLLEEKNVFFWKGNTTREFLDNRGLTDLPEGDMGQAYGYQFRSFNKKVAQSDGDVVDQLQETIKILQKEPFSRRVYTTLWNPSASKYMALTPCWHSHQFVCLPGEGGTKTLHLKLLNRSLDTCYGFQFAVQQYRLYQMCMAKMLGMELGALSCDLTQAHLYSNQLEFCEELVTRDFGTPGKVQINREIASIDDLLSLEWSDIEVQGLVVNDTEFVTQKPPMSA